MNPYFSIITPVYNQERKLEKCVQSLLEQTFQDFEVLFVDDGSTDSSISLIRAMTEARPQFRVIRHDRNRSVLEARITGMKNASGRYVLFVDIDDFLETNALEILHRELEKQPIDLLSYRLHDETRDRILTSPEAEDRLLALLTGTTLSCLMQHVISGEVVREAVSFLRPGYCNMAEDYYISAVLFTLARSFRTLDQELYHYVTGEGMSTSTSGVSLEKLQRQLSHVNLALSATRAFLSEQNPEYVQYLPQTRKIILTGTLWQYAGPGVSWSELFRFIHLFDNEEDEAVFDWACSELLPARALYYKNQEKESSGR